MVYIGIDVQTARGVAWAAVNDGHESVGAGLSPTGPIDEVSTSLLDAIEPLSTDGPLLVGIDAAARRILEDEDFVWVVVGDAAVVKPQLDKLGLPVKVQAAR